MSATKSTTVSVDRELLEELIEKVDGLAMFETLRNGGHDEEGEERHERGRARGREMFGTMVEEVLDDA